jgi:hypothetical protein
VGALHCNAAGSGKARSSSTRAEAVQNTGSIWAGCCQVSHAGEYHVDTVSLAAKVHAQSPVHAAKRSHGCHRDRL